MIPGRQKLKEDAAQLKYLLTQWQLGYRLAALQHSTEPSSRVVYMKQARSCPIEMIFKRFFQ